MRELPPSTSPSAVCVGGKARREASPPPLGIVAEADHSFLRGRWSSEIWRPQGASIARLSLSTGTRTTSCTAGGGLGSSGGLRPRCASNVELHILDHLGLSPPPQEKPPPTRELVRVPVDDEGREFQAG